MKEKETKSYISNTTLGDNFSKGWNLLKDNFLVLISVTLIALLINIPGEMMALATGDNAAFGEAISLLWTVLIVTPVAYGATLVFIRAARGDKFEIGDMFEVFRENYINIVLIGILLPIFILIGLIFLIIPGIIIAVKTAFAPYLILDKKMNAIDSISESWRMTKGYSFTIFGMGIASIFIGIIGLLLLLVGIIPAIAWISAAYAVLYISIGENRETNSGDVIQENKTNSTEENKVIDKS